MAKLGCFPALLPGKRKKKTRKIADANKASGNECPKVKPVELIDATLAAAIRGCEENVAVEDNNKEAYQLASVKGSDLSDFDFHFHAAKKPIRSDGDVALDTAVAEAADPSPKLKRSCSNIETKRPGSRAAPEMPARSRSYGDLGNLITGLALDTTAAAHGAPEASPASVKTSRTADRVMLKKRSSSQRLFLWSHRNLHMPRSASTAHQAACSPGRHCGYTSDTFEEGPAADRKNKKVMVDDSPPPSVPNQWVAFSAEKAIHDRISAWVSSIESEPPFHIAEEDDNYDGEDDEEHGGECASERPRHLELGEPSSGKGGHGKSKRCAAADEVVQANTIVQSLNAFSSVAHIQARSSQFIGLERSH
ncbi:unnamed protein product [Miscanthus lutarioriparius]|uniref:Uncharacterized protein n=1 Tax=Miscanthus lutarioriparius TaxID=422564 RepID=A0A811M8C7_9POAL|nr:unnamed protein product [Miscanthus lutarioriparius]